MSFSGLQKTIEILKELMDSEESAILSDDIREILNKSWYDREDFYACYHQFFMKALNHSDLKEIHNTDLALAFLLFRSNFYVGFAKSHKKTENDKLLEFLFKNRQSLDQKFLEQASYILASNNNDMDKYIADKALNGKPIDQQMALLNIQWQEPTLEARVFEYYEESK